MKNRGRAGDDGTGEIPSPFPASPARFKIYFSPGSTRLISLSTPFIPLRSIQRILCGGESCTLKRETGQKDKEPRNEVARSLENFILMLINVRKSDPYLQSYIRWRQLLSISEIVQNIPEIRSIPINKISSLTVCVQVMSPAKHGCQHGVLILGQCC